MVFFSATLMAAVRRPCYSALVVCCALGTGIAGCRAADRGAETPQAITTVDDTGREITLTAPAQRVVSLVPSGTDILLALGASHVLVGRTDYDTASELAALPSVGGGLDPSLERLVALNPDFVIAWAEAGPTSLRSQLEPLGVSVFGLRSQDTADVFRSIQRLGHVVGRDSAAVRLAQKVRDALSSVHTSVASRPFPSVLYLVEHDPPMIAGPTTFVGQVIGIAGGTHAFPDVAALWPQISLEEIVRRQPDVIILPSLTSLEPFIDRLRETPGWRDLRAVRTGRVIQIPPELLSRPGPQLAEAARLLRDRLHPDVASTR